MHNYTPLGLAIEVEQSIRMQQLHVTQLTHGRGYANEDTHLAVHMTRLRIKLVTRVVMEITILARAPRLLCLRVYTHYVKWRVGVKGYTGKSGETGESGKWVATHNGIMLSQHHDFKGRIINRCAFVHFLEFSVLIVVCGCIAGATAFQSMTPWYFMCNRCPRCTATTCYNKDC